MKKTIALAMIAIFIFSLTPLAFAQDSTSDTNAETSAKSSSDTSGTSTNAKIKATARVRADKKEDAKDKLEAMKDKNQERLQKIADLDKAQIERLSRLEVKNVDKIAQLKKERLERLTKLSEEKIQRISELDKDKLEKVTDLNETELNKFAALGRARLNKLTQEDTAKIRAELKNINIMKIKKAEDLDRRKVSDEKLAGLREKFEKSKEKFNEAKDGMEEAKSKLKEAREKKDEKATLEQAKNYLLRTADALINHLEKIKAKVQESKNIPDDNEAKIVAEIDTQIAEINNIKADVQASTTKEQIKEAAKKLRVKWNRLQHLIKLHAERVVAARVEGIVNSGVVLEKRLDIILQKAKEKNITVDVSAEVSQFSEKIAAANDKYQQAQTKLSSVIDMKLGNATNEQIKAAADEAKELLKQARDFIKEAHDILKTIVKKIKESAPDANLSEETEVEVAEETSDSTAGTGASTTIEANATAQAST